MNFKFAALQTVYMLALAGWVAGDLLIGALVLPAVFGGSPDRAQAGALASAILGRWGTVKAVCLALLAATSLVRYFAWEQGTVWIRARHAALLVMAATFAVGYFGLSPRIDALRPFLAAGDEGLRAEFGRLHGLAVANSMTGVVAGLVALFLS